MRRISFSAVIALSSVIAVLVFFAHGTGAREASAKIWDLGTLPAGKVYPTTVSASNTTCRGKHSFEISTENAPWLKIENRLLEDVWTGQQKSVPAVVDLREMAPGRYTGLLMIRCTSCPPSPKCRQDIQQIEIRVVVEDSGSGELHLRASPSVGGHAGRDPIEPALNVPPDDDWDHCDTCCLIADPCGCPDCPCYPGDGLCRTCPPDYGLQAQQVEPDVRADSLALLRRFRSEVLLNSDEGRSLVRLFYRHRADVMFLMLQKPALGLEAGRIVQEVTPGIESLVGIRREPVRVTRTLVLDIRQFAQDLASEAEASNREELGNKVRLKIRPFVQDRFVGMTFQEAWDAALETPAECEEIVE